MGVTSYERLSAQDSSFVMFEGAGAHVHVSAVAQFGDPVAAEAPPAAPVGAPGALDMARMRAYIESRLHLVAHYRQRLAYTPIQRHPIWIDDERFDISYHVRHAALPRPGTDQQLRELVGQLVSQPLDMERPLWEITLVEGLERGGFAMVAKVHHCMVDGVSGVGVLSALLSPTRDAAFEAAPRWKPRPQPGMLEFLGDGLVEGASLGASTLQSLASNLIRPVQTAETLLGTAAMGWQTLRAGLTPPAETPLNDRIGAQRRIDWRGLDLALVRDLRKRLDGSINDVVLTIVAGALRRFLKERRVKLRGRDVRVVVPVDMRTGEEDASVGNRVSAWFLSLPVSERTPKRRFEQIREQTLELKRTAAEQGVDAFLRFADWAGSTRLPFWGVNIANWIRPYNMIVTNVHGPQVPLYLLGAPMRELTAQVPLFENQGLAVAAMSYLGRINFGITADRDLVPDVEKFGEAIEASFAELCEAAGATA